MRWRSSNGLARYWSGAMPCSAAHSGSPLMRMKAMPSWRALAASWSPVSPGIRASEMIRSMVWRMRTSLAIDTRRALLTRKFASARARSTTSRIIGSSSTTRTCLTAMARRLRDRTSLAIDTRRALLTRKFASARARSTTSRIIGSSSTTRTCLTAMARRLRSGNTPPRKRRASGDGLIYHRRIGPPIAAKRLGWIAGAHGESAGSGDTGHGSRLRRDGGERELPGALRAHPPLDRGDADRGAVAQAARGRAVVPPHRHHLRGLYRGRRPGTAHPLRHRPARTRQRGVGAAVARTEAARARPQRLHPRRLPRAPDPARRPGAAGSRAAQRRLPPGDAGFRAGAGGLYPYRRHRHRPPGCARLLRARGQLPHALRRLLHARE